ncbi:hypothetical protein TWF730_005078 [Orbilia blumenaviensis]|uniref:Uncharacterized protein n=1 Tax=Orbilia blumenaviensis TaxID=1796055 RepID=A0AAV9VJN2_9PEZI
MSLARGLLFSAWLSLVVAIPIPQGGGGSSAIPGSDGDGGDSGGSDDSSGSDSSVSIAYPIPLQPETGYLRTTAQTRQLLTNPQTLGGNSPINRLTTANGGTIGQDSASGVGGGGTRAAGVETSLRKILSGSSPVDAGRRKVDPINPSIYNGKLAPPGLFAELEGESGWPWRYTERLPPDTNQALNGPVKLPPIYLGQNQNQNQNQDQTRLSSPYGSNPPTVRLSGQEGIYRNSGQLGSTVSRKLAQQLTTPLESSRYVNHSPNKTGNSAVRGIPGSPSLNSGYDQDDVVRQDFVESYRSQYPEFAETIEYVTDGNRNLSPEKQILEQFGFTTTPRIRPPPMADLGRNGAGGGRNNIVPERKESDLYPVDLENILSQYVDTEDVDNDMGVGKGVVGSGGGSAGTKASCDVTDLDCVDTDTLPLASQVTRANGNFQVRNPGRLGGMTQRTDVNMAVPLEPPESLEWDPPRPGFRDERYDPPPGYGGYTDPNKRGPKFTVASHMWPPTNRG